MQSRREVEVEVEVEELIKVHFVEDDGPIRAVLEIDVDEYCTAVQKINALTEQKERLQFFQAMPDCAFDDFALLEKEMNRATEEFNCLRDPLLRQLRGLPGEILCTRLMGFFQTSLRKRGPAEAALSQQMAQATMPLVCEVVKKMFAEFVKNSIDAVIERKLSLKNKSPALVKLSVSIALTEDGRTTISLLDNAGGFTPEALDKLGAMLSAKKYLLASPVSGKCSSIYFGGNGLGLRNLFALLLDGVAINRDKEATPLYTKASCAGSEVHIRNTEEGAEVILIGSSSSGYFIEVDSPETTQDAAFGSFEDDSEKFTATLLPPPIMTGTRANGRRKPQLPLLVETLFNARVESPPPQCEDKPSLPQRLPN